MCLRPTSSACRPGELHDVVEVDGSLVADIVQGAGDAVHVQIAGIGDDFLIPLVARDGAVDVAEVDVEDLPSLAKTGGEGGE